MRTIIITPFLFILILLGCHSGSIDSHSENSKQAATQETYVCDHCYGTGYRVNQLTGEYGDCSTCNGTGNVDKYNHERLVMEHEPLKTTIPSQNTYQCPNCGGAGLQTNITETGLSQSSCTLCKGTGKVDQWTYENINN
ncbi:MAG: hypothetical protein IPK08_19545 [Bacteroidetes bacterium]|nr:hypothetical protein [Bacteroidota bacterium]MBK9045613.1 hypothetical protein [Bacteroidota bacterium]